MYYHILVQGQRSPLDVGQDTFDEGEQATAGDASTGGGAAKVTQFIDKSDQGGLCVRPGRGEKSVPSPFQVGH